MKELFDMLTRPLDVPCRVSADIRRHHENDLMPPEQLCEYDEDHLKQIVPDRLVKPLALLMLSRMQIANADGIEGLNKERALEFLRKDAQNIYEALNELWGDL